MANDARGAKAKGARGTKAKNAQGAEGQAVDAMLREYNVLRAEIALYRQEQNRSLIFAMVGTYALASAFYVVRDFHNAGLLQRALLLVLALFVMINGIAFADRNRRVKRIARYLHSYLRPKLTALLGGIEVWHWEFFKEVFHEKEKGQDRWLGLVLDKFRLAFFWLATVASWGLYIWQLVAECSFGCTLPGQILLTSHREQIFFTPPMGLILLALLPELILLALNFGVFLVFLLASKGIQETKGALSDTSWNKNIDALSKKQLDALSAQNGEAK